MTLNKRTVEMYMEGFRRTDREAILSCLTHDVEWEIPGMFKVQGRDAFDSHIMGRRIRRHPIIEVRRMTEENDVVIAEGTVIARATMARSCRSHSVMYSRWRAAKSGDW
jgi:uncharacterized protein